ncbi:PHP domain-containing protein [Natronorubrum tibetense]|uniref:PHP domain-containing protein n=1 Tax=Natronorubrum tibetense GA33 TaxID=1114856 RepID=L9W0F1_9EURY|nr:hypothetical protein [Natronorubrum tibetense]ELY41798.1 hypothetical protein C496_08386 [Natronorubrum tibetense GA33]
MSVTSPYDDIDWNLTDHHRAQLHLHEPRNRIDSDSDAHEPAHDAVLEETRPSPATVVEKYRNAGYTVLAVTEHEYYVDGTKHKGEPYFDGLEETSWPWTRWGVDPDALGMAALEGAELRGSFGGLEGLHDIVNLGTALGYGHEEPLETVATDVEERGGVTFLPHPGKYVDPADPDDLESYVDLFARTAGLLGLEAFNARDRYPNCRAIWDELLCELGTERPIWAFANDDYHAKRRPAGAERFDRSRTVLVLEDCSPTSVLDALRAGRSYVQYDGDGEAPPIDRIDVDDDRIRIRAPAAESITWIADGASVDRGSETTAGDVDASSIRAEVSAANGAVTCTQPFFLDAAHDCRL